MRFTDQLRKDSDVIFNGIFQHPYITGLGEGEVPKEALIHYVKADYNYLNAFMNIYGLAIAKSSNREEMKFFNQQIDFVLNSEVHPHHNLCRAAGVNYGDLQGEPLPPTAHQYVNHMKVAALQGSMGELLAALLPCPWTYLEIGAYLMNTYNPDQSHPFYEWISFYADGAMDLLTNELRNRLDKWADMVGELEKEKARDAFIKSCQLEYKFWEMAYTQEQWPFSLTTEEV